MAAPIFHKTHLVDSVSLFLKVVAMILMLQTAHDGGVLEFWSKFYLKIFIFSINERKSDFSSLTLPTKISLFFLRLPQNVNVSEYMFLCKSTAYYFWSFWVKTIKESVFSYQKKDFHRICPVIRHTVPLSTKTLAYKPNCFEPDQCGSNRRHFILIYGKNMVALNLCFSDQSDI